MLSRVFAQESRRLGMNFIMPEHIIIAMLSVGDVGARQVVQRYSAAPHAQPSSGRHNVLSLPHILFESQTFVY